MGILASYARFRWTWGGIDFEGGSGNPYSAGQTGPTLGTSAAAGSGVGVRRCVLHFDRTAGYVGADDAESHFDFLNITGGTPDDTWTDTDYATLEGFLDTWWATLKANMSTNIKLAGYHWYRHGPGITGANPAQRVTTRSVPGVVGSSMVAPQVATSVTFRTAVRRSWGRTYLPGPSVSSGSWDSGGLFSSAWVTAVATPTNTLIHDAIGADFPLVVVSNRLSAVLNVEALEVDNMPDVIRRRRYRNATLKSITNT